MRTVASTLFFLSLFSTVSLAQQIHLNLGHSDAVRCLDYSPDGKYLLTGSDDTTLKIWDLESGIVLRTYFGLADGVRAVKFSQDGQFFVATSSPGMVYDGSIQVWDIQDSQPVRTLSFEDHNRTSTGALCFSPDGKYLLSGSDDDKVRLWQFASGDLIRTFGGHSSDVTALDISPDAKYFVSGNRNNVVKLSSFPDGKEIWSDSAHSKSIECVRFSPDDRLILSGSWDHTLRLLDTDSGNELRVFSDNEGPIVQGYFSANGRYLISAAGYPDYRVRVRDITTGAEVWSRKFSGMHGFGYSEGLDQLAVMEGKSVVRIDASTGKEVGAMKNRIDRTYNVTISTASNLLSFSNDQSIRFFDLKAGREKESFPSNYRNQSSFVSDQFDYVGGAGVKSVWIADLNTRQKRKIPIESRGYINVTISPDQSKILTGTELTDNKLYLYDLGSESLIRTFEGHSRYIGCFTFLPGGRHIASASFDNTVKIWDIQTGEVVHNFQLYSFPESLRASPDGKYVSCGLVNGHLLTWDLTGKPVFFGGEKHRENIMSINFSADGNMMVSGSWDKTIRLWDMRSRRMVKVIEGHSGPVLSIAIIQDKDIIVSASFDGSVKFWDIPSGTELFTYYRLNEPDGWIATTPSGEIDLSANAKPLIYATDDNGLVSHEALFNKSYTPGLIRSILYDRGQTDRE